MKMPRQRKRGASHQKPTIDDLLKEAKIYGYQENSRIPKTLQQFIKETQYLYENAVEYSNYDGSKNVYDVRLVLKGRAK